MIFFTKQYAYDKEHFDNLVALADKFLMNDPEGTIFNEDTGIEISKFHKDCTKYDVKNEATNERQVVSSIYQAVDLMLGNGWEEN